MKNRVLALLLALVMVMTVVPAIALADGTEYVAKIGDTGYTTLAEAIAVGGEVKLLADIVLPEPLTVTGTVTLDLAGFGITYSNTVQGEAMITNKGNLTINDSGENGVINYNYTGAADSSYGKGNYTISNGGTLTVNGGKITIANLRAHAKYPIDNNSTSGNAVLVINGGHLYNYNTSAIRQFCNSTTNTNSVTINGGLIEGYCAIWMQNPGNKTVNGTLSITGGEIKTTASDYVNGTSELKDVGSHIYCTIDGEGGAWDGASSVSITGGTINENVNLAEETPAAITVGENVTFMGYVNRPTSVAEVNGKQYASLATAIAQGGEVKLLADITLTEVVTISDNVTIKADKAVTITTAKADVFDVGQGGNLTLGENITVNSSVGAILYAHNGGTININGANLTAGANEENTLCYVEAGTVNMTAGSMASTKKVAIKTVNADAKVNISGGTVSSAGDNAIWATAGTVIISDTAKIADTGTNSNGEGYVTLWAQGGTINVSGGEVESKGYTLSVESNGSSSVTGGTFAGPVKANGGTLAISGGTFSSDPSDYVADDCMVNENEADATWTVSKIIDAGVAAGGVEGSVAENIEGVTVEQIKEVASSEAVNTVLANTAKNLDVSSNEDTARQVLESANVEIDETKEITVEVKPYLNIAVTDYNVGTTEEAASMTVDIKALYDVYAVNGANKVKMNDASEEMTVEQEITITVPLATGLVTSVEDKLYVHHYKNGTLVDTYTAEITEKDGTFFATFTNPHGFSTFVFNSVAPEIKVGYNLTLESYIDFSFFMYKTDVPEDATVTITVGTEDKTITNWENYSDSTWRFRYADVAPAEYEDALTLTVKDSEGNVIATETQSIKSYAETRVSKAESDKDMMQALLAYCAACKEYFNK